MNIILKQQLQINIIAIFLLSFSSCKDFKKEAIKSFNEGDYETAEVYFKKVLVGKSNDFYSLYNLARALEEQKKFDESMDNYSRLLKLDNKHMEGYLGRARVSFQMGFYGPAAEDSRIVLRNIPDCFEAIMLRGRAYLKEEKFFRAIYDLSDAIDLRPDHTSAYYYRGLARAQLGDLRAAIIDFNIVIENQPHEKAYFNRGLCFQAIDAYSRAISDYKAALSINENMPTADLNLGLCYISLGNNAASCNAFISARKKGEKAADRYLADYCR